MIAYVVAQLPFRERESAEDYQQHLYSETGIDPVIREIEGNYIVVLVSKTESVEQARALNRLLSELPWNERHPQVVVSQFLDGSNVPGANEVPITVGITPATREETEKERAYRVAYRKTEAFKRAQQRYQQSSEGRAAQRRYEQSEKGKEARKKYFQSDKYKAARRRYQEKRRMMDRVCPECDRTVRDHELQEHVLVTGKDSALLIHRDADEDFVMFKSKPEAQWVNTNHWEKDE